MLTTASDLNTAGTKSLLYISCNKNIILHKVFTGIATLWSNICIKFCVKSWSSHRNLWNA